MSSEKESGQRRSYSPTRYPGVIFRVVQGRAGGKSQDSVFYIKYRTPDKRQHFEPVGRSSEGMTAAKANMIRAARIEGRALGNVAAREKAAREKMLGECVNIRKLWELYDKDKTQRSSRKTDSSNIAHLGDLLDREPSSITTRDIVMLRKRLESTAGRRLLRGKVTNLSPQTVKHVLELFQRILNYGQKQGFFVKSSGLTFDMPALDNQKTENMTDEQMIAYWEALEADHDQLGAAYLALILLTGIRKHAALSLKWSDVDFVAGILTLRGEEAKNNKTQHIPLNKEALAILEKIPRTGSEYLFPGKKGGHREGFAGISKRVKERAGLPPDFRPIHGLRHTFASHLASTGRVSMFELQQLMTHGSPAMTARYAHLADSALRRAAEQASVLKPEKKTH